MKCTWAGCEAVATKPQIRKDGSQWANLCDAHDARLEAGLKEMNLEALLRAWVMANGGSKILSRKMTGVIS